MQLNITVPRSGSTFDALPPGPFRWDGVTTGLFIKIDDHTFRRINSTTAAERVYSAAFFCDHADLIPVRIESIRVTDL